MASYVLNAPDPNPNPMTASRARSDINKWHTIHKNKMVIFTLLFSWHHTISSQGLR